MRSGWPIIGYIKEWVYIYHNPLSASSTVTLLPFRMYQMLKILYELVLFFSSVIHSYIHSFIHSSYLLSWYRCRTSWWSWRILRGCRRFPFRWRKDGTWPLGTGNARCQPWSPDQWKHAGKWQTTVTQNETMTQQRQTTVRQWDNRDKQHWQRTKVEK